MAKYISTIKYRTNTGDIESYRIKATTLKSVYFNDNNEEVLAASGTVPFATGDGRIVWKELSTGVSSIGTKTGAITLGSTLQFGAGSASQKLSCVGMQYQMTAPTEPSTDGYKVAILSASEAAGITYKSGWIYYILEA